MGGGPLETARKEYLRGHYQKVIALLQNQIFRYRDNHSYHYLMGMSCLFTGDYGGASSFLKRASSLDEEDSAALMALGVTSLMRHENPKAIAYLLEVLELEPQKSEARKGLELIRSGRIEEWPREKVFKKLLPGFQKGRSRVWILPLIVLAAAGSLVFVQFRYGIPDVKNLLQLIGSEPEPLRQLPSVELEPGQRMLDSRGSADYIMTEEGVEDTLEAAVDYLVAFRDNLAQRELNRILNSNASGEIKEKALLLQGYVQEPDFSSFRDNFSYTEIAEDPSLFEGCFVMWKGRASNISVTQERIRFDFLVGYHQGQVLEGIAQVTFREGLHVVPDYPYEVLASVAADQEGNWELKGLGIHRLEKQQ